eukprot:scaffold97515_cov63-Phaeocystis_antarctica.AAC.4
MATQTVGLQKRQRRRSRLYTRARRGRRPPRTRRTRGHPTSTQFVIYIYKDAGSHGPRPARHRRTSSHRIGTFSHEHAVVAGVAILFQHRRPHALGKRPELALAVHMAVPLVDHRGSRGFPCFLACCGGRRALGKWHKDVLRSEDVARATIALIHGPGVKERKATRAEHAKSLREQQAAAALA